MEKEKRKRGLAKEAKNGWISCFMSLLMLILMPLGVLLFCVVVFVLDFNSREAEAFAKIQPIVRETCNLPDYQSNTASFDFMDSYYWDEIEDENLIASCHLSNQSWNCRCFEPPD